MEADIIYLKQKCNALIDRAQTRMIVLKEKQELLDRLKSEKAVLEVKLRRIEADKRRNIQQEPLLTVDNAQQNENSNDVEKKFLPMVLVQRALLPVMNSENHPSAMEQELFPLIFAQQVKENYEEQCAEDILIEWEPEEDEFYTDVNYREADANSYKRATDRRQLDIPEETVIIYEHGGFYEVLRKIGYLIMLLFVLLLMGCAVVAVMTTLL